MSIKRMITRNKSPNDTFILQHLGYSDTTKNSVGDALMEWSDTHTLTLLLQAPSSLEYGGKGRMEVTEEYRAFTIPDFDIPDEKLPEYRIKHIDGDNVVHFYDILKINRNLFLKGSRHHYEMTLTINPKHE